MKQFQFEFINAEQLTKELEKISLWVKNTMTSGVSFQIFAETMEHDRVKEVCSLIKSVLSFFSFPSLRKKQMNAEMISSVGYMY